MQSLRGRVHSVGSAPSQRAGTAARRRCLRCAAAQLAGDGGAQPAPHQAEAQQQARQQTHPLRPLKLVPPKRRPAQQHSQHVALPQAEDDWRAARARLVAMERSGALSVAASPGKQLPASWAHELAAPEAGCVLVARRQGLEFFDGTVVLVAAHDDAQGSIGFILNRGSQLALSEVAASSKGAVARVADVFGGQRLRVGGPVHLDTLTVLHGYSGCAGAQKVIDGVYYGGLPAAADMVRSGLAAPGDFKLLLGLAGWAPGQLAAEVEAGVWHCAAASRSVIMPRSGGEGSMRRQILNLIGR